MHLWPVDLDSIGWTKIGNPLESHFIVRVPLGDVRRLVGGRLLVVADPAPHDNKHPEGEQHVEQIRGFHRCADHFIDSPVSERMRALGGVEMFHRVPIVFA